MSCADVENGYNEFSLENVKKYMLPVLEREHGNLKSEEDDTNQSLPSKECEFAIILFTAEFIDTSAVLDETYARTKAVLDGKDEVLVEITAILGYYAYVSYTLNVFNIPSGMDPVK